MVQLLELGLGGLARRLWWRFALGSLLGFVISPGIGFDVDGVAVLSESVDEGREA